MMTQLNLKNSFLYFCLLFYIFGTRLSLPFYAPLFLIGPIYAFLNLKTLKSFLFNYNIQLFLIIIIFLIIYYSLNSYLHENFDFTFFTVLISLIIYTYFGYWIRSNYKYFTVNRYFILIIIITILNCSIILVEFFFPNIQELIELYNFQEITSNIDYKSHYFKMRGISFGGGASLSIFTSISGILIYKFSNKIGFIATNFVYLLLLLSIFFVGRSGLAIVLLTIFIYLISKFNIKNILTYATFLSIIYFLFFDFILDNIKNDFVIEYSTDWIITFFDSGTIEDDSVSTFQDMIHFPRDFFTILFGNGYYFNHIDNLHTDSGILKLLYNYGYIISALIYAFLFFIFYKIYKFYDEPIILIIFILLFVFEIKEPILFTNYSSRFIFTLMGFYFYDKTN